MTESAVQRTATIDGLLLFGSRPQRFLPQSGIRAICYTGANRDYATRADEDIRRLEVTSPGKLPNTVTPEGMRRGLRYARNQTLVNVMRDYA